MKKTIIFTLTSVVITVLLTFFFREHIKIDDVHEGTTNFKYGDINETNSLSLEDTNIISEIFCGKTVCYDIPACGFSDDVSIKFNDEQIFCFACDGCPIVYWKNKNKYFKLTDAELNRLHNILRKYGFVFPCV